MKHHYDYDENQEPIVLSKHLLDTFLKEPHPSELISLYAFYYYTAKWQKTNQPKATTAYAAKGLKWTEAKVRQHKKRLIELNLVDDLTSRDAKGHITAHYIRIYFVWCKETVETLQNPPCGESNSVGKHTPNALSPNKENALSTIINGKELGVGEVELVPIEQLKSPSSPKENDVPLDPNKGWSGRVIAMWSRKCDGDLEGWKLKAIKPLVIKHGADVVIVALKKYFDDTEVKYVSLARFAATFGEWHHTRAKWLDNPERKQSPSRQG